MGTNWLTVQTGTKCAWGEAGHAISELCAGQATKIVYVGTNNDRDALLSNWRQTMKHRSEDLFRQMQTETYMIRSEGSGVPKP